MTVERWEKAIAGILLLSGIAEFTVGDAIGWLGFILAIVLIAAIILLLFRVAGWYGRRTNGHSVSSSLILEKIAALDAQIKRMEKQHALEREQMEKRHQAEIAEIKKERDELKEQAQANAELRKELEEKHVIEPQIAPQQLNVLGIWPDAPGLEAKANAQALELSGVKYNRLFGDKASMEDILYELKRGKYTAIEVGARGNADAIELVDGLATAPWWAGVARAYKISLLLLLSDNSTGTSQLSISDAVFQVPSIVAVIAVQGKVPDPVARRFARMLYANLGQGATLADAMSEAKLAATPEYEKLFVLREKSPSGDD